MNEPIFILRGDICYSRNLTELAVIKQGYVICMSMRPSIPSGDWEWIWNFWTG